MMLTGRGNDKTDKFPSASTRKVKNRQTDRQTDRRTNRQTHLRIRCVYTSKKKLEQRMQGVCIDQRNIH